MHADLLNDSVLNLLQLLAVELGTLLVFLREQAQIRDVRFCFVLDATYAAGKLSHQILVVLIIKDSIVLLLI